jgi:methyl-accepting chemotaxis protein
LELVPSIRKTSELVQDVAAACREQATGVTQINTAIATVDQVTQRNASAAEELASTAEELSSQAEALRELMGFFRVAEFPLVPDGYPSRTSGRPVNGAARHVTPTVAAGKRANGRAMLVTSGDAEFQRF